MTKEERAIRDADFKQREQPRLLWASQENGPAIRTSYGYRAKPAVEKHSGARKLTEAEDSAATRQLRSLEKPWLRLPETDQKRVLREVQDSVAEAVKKAVEVIASGDRTYFRAGVEQVTFKEGVKAVLTMPNTEASHELADTAGGSVLVCIEDPSRYTFPGDNMPQPEKDQAEIPA